MNKGSSIVQAIMSIKRAKDLFEDFNRQYPNTLGCVLGKRMVRKCDAMFADIVSTSHLSSEVIEAIRNEWNSDPFAIDSITEMAAMLTPDQLESCEELLKCLLSGEKITVQLN